VSGFTPLHVGGVPKVLLAYMPAQERRQVLYLASLPRITDRTITDPRALEKVLDQILRDGYHVAVGDLDEGVHSIAAPIRNYAGRVVAAVSIAGPSQRFSADKIRYCIDLVCTAAGEISNKLGYVQPGGTSGRRIPELKIDSKEGMHHGLI
jgi:IclR family KDG regulon transcriptional repressor